jgi:leucine dehydrogenase
MTTLADVTQDHPEAAHCDALYEVRDEVVGLHAFIALHDLSRGPGYGGVRRRGFGRVRDAVREVVSLAEQMTLKTAFAGLPAGGAKAVIIDRPGLDKALLYERLGQAIEQLGGAFIAGPDVGTSELELAALRHTARFVVSAEGQPAQSAATGVVAACREALAFIGAPLTCRGVVAGVGAVGSLVARGLAEAGLELALADIDAARAGLVASELRTAGAAASSKVATLPAEEALYAEADLLSPCAIGPIVTEDNIARFRVRVICGSANQQLQDETLAHELSERGVLYVPDFAVNAGAVIEGVLRQTAPPGTDPNDAVRAAIDAIGPRVRELLESARRADVTPLEAALMWL